MKREKESSCLHLSRTPQKVLLDHVERTLVKHPTPLLKAVSAAKNKGELEK